LTKAAAGNSENLQDGFGGVIPLHYVFLEPIFSDNISAALTGGTGRYPVFTSFPWDSAFFIVTSIEQTTIDDTLHTLNLSNYQKYPEYNLYSVISEPGFPVEQNTTCFTSNSSSPCTVTVQLQVSTNNLVGTTRQSGHPVDSSSTIIDEGGVVGGVSFFAFSLSIYLI